MAHFERNVPSVCCPAFDLFGPAFLFLILGQLQGGQQFVKLFVVQCFERVTKEFAGRMIGIDNLPLIMDKDRLKGGGGQPRP